MKKNVLLLLLLAVCILRLWVMPLWSSFWVDEIGTAFVVKYGAYHWSFDVAPQFRTSIYYLLPRAVQSLFGFSEVAYRLPSLILMAAALVILWKLGARLIDADAAWVAVFSCFALPGFNFQAADARPYCLATFLTLSALWFLVRWFDSGRNRDAVLFVVCAGLIWWVHLLMWPVYPLFALYATVRLTRRDTNVSWTRVVLYFGLVVVAVLPVVRDVLALMPEAKAHSISRPPTMFDFMTATDGYLVALVAIVSLCVADGQPSSTSLSGWILTLGLFLVQPLSLAAYSHATGVSVFIPRYVYVALAGAALSIAAVARLAFSGTSLRAVGMGLGVCGLLLYGDWDKVWPLHHGPSTGFIWTEQDWRAGAHAVNTIVANEPDLPVICLSPFYESKDKWYPDYPDPSFFFAQLAIYPIRGRVYKLPYDRSPAADVYATELVHSVLGQTGRFLMYGGPTRIAVWRNAAAWSGWRQEDISTFGQVGIVRFERRTRVIGANP